MVKIPLGAFHKGVIPMASTIHVDSSDKTMKAFDISNIRNCEDVKEQLSRLVEQERDNKRVSSREFIGGYGDDEDHGFDEEDSPY